MRTIALIAVTFFVLGVEAQVATAAVVLNEVQIAPSNERFVELYNPDSSDVDLTGWYIQRKTATGSSFSSLVTSTQFNEKTIRAHGYFLISRGQLPNTDITVDNLTLTESNTLRMRDSKGSDIDQVTWGNIDEGKSYQRASTSEWVVAVPTPGAGVTPGSSYAASQATSIASAQTSTSASSLSVSSFPVEPQIFAKITAQTQTVSVGAAATFTGRTWGLKKEPIENARMTWALGDGATAEGTSVSHVYYYPGEYLVVLDVASGYYAASDRVRVVAVTPSVVLTTGGDVARSFVALENRGNDELDLSGWQVVAAGKTFIVPKNTLVGAHKTLTFASEVTGLVTPTGSVATLHFPNGMMVLLQSEPIIKKVEHSQNENKPTVVAAEEVVPVRVSHATAQTANVLDAVTDTRALLDPVSPDDTSWVWYTSVALLGAFALLGFRFSQRENVPAGTLTADDFEIVEDKNSKKDDLF